MLYLASDHAGYRLKEYLKKVLAKKKIRFTDLGTDSEAKVDYPDYAKMVSLKVAFHPRNKGILMCGTGIGMCIAANKIKGIRAAMVFDEYSARMSREHNDVNIICLRGRNFSKAKAAKLALLWLKTNFSNGKRHIRRLRKISAMER